MTPAEALVWDECGVGVTLLLYSLPIVLGMLRFLLQSGNGWSIECAFGDAAVLESPAIVFGPDIIIAMSNHFAATNDYSTMTIVEGRLISLLEAQRQIIVGLHFVSGERCC